MVGVQITTRTDIGRNALKQHIADANSNANKALKKLLRMISGSRGEPFLIQTVREEPYTVRILVADKMLQQVMKPEALVDKAVETMGANGAKRGVDYEVRGV